MIFFQRSQSPRTTRIDSLNGELPPPAPPWTFSISTYRWLRWPAQKQACLVEEGLFVMSTGGNSLHSVGWLRCGLAGGPPGPLELVSFLFLPGLPPAPPEARGPSLPDHSPWLQAAKSFPLQTATSIHLCLLAPQGLDRELLTLRRLKVQGQPSADKWVAVGGGCCFFLASEEGPVRKM